MRFVRNNNVMRQITIHAQRALALAALDIRADLVESGTVPLESGHLQNQATYVDAANLSHGRVAVVSDTVYARRKYFHPEFNFDQSVNPNAGGRWFDTYLTGGKRYMVRDRFVANLRK